MALDSMPLFAVLKNKMNWHQSRQTVLAENVANADTPGYKGHDLAPFKVEQATGRGAQVLPPIGMARTSAGHIQGSVMADARSNFGGDNQTGWEITPDGNGVILEEQMMKVTGNAGDYQTASLLYSRSLGILKTALRGRG